MQITEYIVHITYFRCMVFVHTDMPLERKTPTAYPDGTYEIVQEESRGNVLVIANLTQNGLTGLGSEQRTAFFTFFGQLMHNVINLFMSPAKAASPCKWTYETIHLHYIQ